MTGNTTGTPMNTFEDEMEDELERVRRTCEDLGADQEMTELVLASHCHNPAPLGAAVSAGGGVRDYVEGKLAIWEAIFREQ
jgi:hypothetical protein